MTLLHGLGSARNGGAETFFLTLIKELGARGVEQSAIIKHHAGREAALDSMSIPHRTAPFGGQLDPYTGYLFGRMARRTKASTILTWMSRASWHAPNGRSKGGARVMARVGGFYNIKYYKACDHIIAIAPQIADHLTNQGWPSDRVSVIPNFCAVNFDVPAVNRADFDTPTDSPVILALSRLHPVKGLDTLIRAVAGIDGAYLWLAGDGAEETALRALAEDLGVADRVRFLGWRSDRAALLNAADIVAFPSRREPLGSVVVEAWASGKPIVASDVDGPAWLIEHGETGLLAPPDNVDALRSHLSSLIASPEDARRLADNGLREVSTTYNRDLIMSEYLQTLMPG